MNKLLLTIAALVVIMQPMGYSAASTTASKELMNRNWKFDGVFGKFDLPSIQRGYKVYSEVCHACHSLKRVAFRNLTSIGFSEAEIKALAESYQIKDGPNDDGEMFERPGITADHIPDPFDNKKAAVFANNGAYPPDLSLIIKARQGGADYVYSLLLGYKSTEQNSDGLYENYYFPAGALAMAPPISKDIIEYTDGTQTTVENMAYDVVNFLHWAAEPEMQSRKIMGMKVISFMIVATIIIYFAYKEIWSSIK